MTMKKNKEPEDFLPLSPIVYHILVALGDGRLHGYAMMQEIAERTEGSVELLPGTLYSTIKRMLGDGLLEKCDPPPGAASSDERRRYYRLTAFGRMIGVAETRRMSVLVRLARKKGLAPSR